MLMLICVQEPELEGRDDVALRYDPLRDNVPKNVK